MQPIQIVLANTSNEGQPECPVDLAGGEVRAGQITHKNLVPLPFDSSGPATLRLELATGKVLDFNVRSLVIEPTGEGRYVEDLRTISDRLMPTNILGDKLQSPQREDRKLETVWEWGRMVLTFNPDIQGFTRG